MLHQLRMYAQQAPRSDNSSTVRLTMTEKFPFPIPSGGAAAPPRRPASMLLALLNTLDEPGLMGIFGLVAVAEGLAAGGFIAPIAASADDVMIAPPLMLPPGLEGFSTRVPPEGTRWAGCNSREKKNRSGTRAIPKRHKGENPKRHKGHVCRRVFRVVPCVKWSRAHQVMSNRDVHSHRTKIRLVWESNSIIICK